MECFHIEEIGWECRAWWLNGVCQASHVPPQERSGPDAKGVLRTSFVHKRALKMV
jgi:hypothetical protein